MNKIEGCDYWMVGSIEFVQCLLFMVKPISMYAQACEFEVFVICVINIIPKFARLMHFIWRYIKYEKGHASRRVNATPFNWFYKEEF
jgi:hypothetical protein